MSTWGMRVEGSYALVDSYIFIDNKKVGIVTSSTWSPYQVCGVGIVHMKNNDLGPGAILDVKCTDGNIRKGELCKLPMYDAKGEIVRGVNTDIPSQPKPWEGLSNN